MSIFARKHQVTETIAIANDDSSLYSTEVSNTYLYISPKMTSKFCSSAKN